MKEHPILFSTPMVKAILDGKKTQTRRVVSNLDLIQDWGDGCKDNAPCYADEFGDWHKTEGRCPYGYKDHLLWVRETWKVYDRRDLQPCVFYKASQPDVWPHLKWKPSIYMPKGFCRIWLKVKGVRVERLNDISEEDAKAEGIQWDDACPYGCADGYYPGAFDTRKGAFGYLWDSINGKPRNNGQDISWKANPWVWVIEFERIEK